MKPKNHDTIRLLEAIPEESLLSGAIGVIVAEFTEPEEAYEIEFCDENGITLTELALKIEQFEVVR
jgi:hypothetical protein